jgi:membrane-associated phospholipid phosphatase
MTAHTRTPERWALRLVVPIVIVAVTAAVALDDLPGWEETVFRRLHGLPGVLVPALWAPMQLGTLWAPGVVAAVTWIAWGRWRPSVGAAVAGVVGWTLAQVVKEAVDRARPHALLADLDRWTGAPIGGWGYLSGHTTVAFVLAAVVSPYLTRRPRAAVYALAGVVGFARVHLGAHLPLDVVAGAALGYAVGWLWNLAVGVPDLRLGPAATSPQEELTS